MPQHLPNIADLLHFFKAVTAIASRTVVEAVTVPETKAAIPLEEIGHLSPATPLPLFGNRWIKSVRVRAQRPPL